MRAPRLASAAWLILVFLAPSAAAQRVGSVRFPISCQRAVQPEFNRAVALLHSFAFAQATDAFQAILRTDSSCVMAYWGLALTAWGNPFAAGIKPPAQIRRGLDAVTRGRSLPAPSPREAGYLAAAAHLYEHADSIDQRARLLAYRDAMATLAAREPVDTEAAIFHALALAISADPTDKSFASQLEAGATLERLFAVLPDHPGLAHYLIHSYDVPSLARRALPAARRYGQIAPVISHALHMPSHTYTRLGLWRQSVAANDAAGRAALREGPGSEELHAADYRMYAYLQLGEEKEARRLGDSLPALISRFDPTAIGTGAPAAAGYFAIAAIPARYALERGDWAAAAKLELRPSPVPFANAVTWFARGLGAARSGDSVGARAAIDALEGIRATLTQAGERYWAEQAEIQREGVAAWATLLQGKSEQALSEMRAAAAREEATEKNAITPGPLAPARELLGEMLLQLNRPADALLEFKATLANEPNRRRALRGVAAAAKAP